MKIILGRKLNMTQRFAEDAVIPVTAVTAGPCTITQVKGEKDGYQAVQVGYDATKKKQAKGVTGHLKGLELFRTMREFRMDPGTLKRGQQITVSTFKIGDVVQVTGISKGKGFQGVVKRHHFSGSPASHGHKDQLRMPGSIGPTEPKHVFKGTRMAGRMGGDQVTVHNLEIIDVDASQNLLYIKGAIPGARNGLLLIAGEGELVITEPVAAAPTVEATAVEKNEQVAAVEEQTEQAVPAAAVSEPVAPEKAVEPAVTKSEEPKQE